jgi:hypothetical protein
MVSEPKELAEARALLARFEADMARADSMGHLADALALLADIRDSEASTSYAQLAENVALSYSRKVHARVEALLSGEPLIHWDTLNHWEAVFAEFERSGFVLPQETVETRSRLWKRKADRAT